MLKLIPDQVPSKRSYKPAFDLLHQVKESAVYGGKMFTVALQRENGYVSRYDLPLPERNESAPEIIYLAERIVKFLLWSSGGWRLMLSGPPKICQAIKKAYSPNGTRKFDYQFMSNVYGQNMVVERLPHNEIPQNHERALMMDSRTGGNRLGLEINLSDINVCAIKNGREVFKATFFWDPGAQKDPDYHYSRINDALRAAASHLKKVDAVGCSTPGVVVDNQIKVATLFRAVPEERYPNAQNIFIRLANEWQVPFEVVNNGDVNALSGLVELGKKGVLAVRLGSSEAVGYVDNRGCVTGRLNELAFAPVDFHPAAPADEWSGDIGVGSMYFSQQAVNWIAQKKGIRFPPKMTLAERLNLVQERMRDGDPAALNVFQKIGLYLGHTIPWYREFYDFNHFLVLGNVTKGLGGVLITEIARLILQDRFPELEDQIEILMLDDQIRKKGQPAAAAALPML